MKPPPALTIVYSYILIINNSDNPTPDTKDSCAGGVMALGCAPVVALVYLGYAPVAALGYAPVASLRRDGKSLRIICSWERLFIQADISQHHKQTEHCCVLYLCTVYCVQYCYGYSRVLYSMVLYHTAQVPQPRTFSTPREASEISCCLFSSGPSGFGFSKECRFQEGRWVCHDSLRGCYILLCGI